VTAHGLRDSKGHSHSEGYWDGCLADTLQGAGYIPANTAQKGTRYITWAGWSADMLQRHRIYAGRHALKGTGLYPLGPKLG